jgi:ubiquinone/menaquinone biosynthesis C-methylase UbiE
MLRFRWWSHHLRRTRHLPHKIIRTLWEPMGVLPQAKDDVSLVPTSLALAALERNSSIGDNTFMFKAARQMTPAHVADSPFLPPQVFASQQQYSLLSASPVLSPLRSKKTDVLPPLEIPNTPTTPDMTPIPARSDTLYMPPTTHSESKENKDSKSSKDSRDNTGSQSGRLALQAPYLIPLDTVEVNRLDFQHHALRQALKGNYAAPVDNPRSILDVGTGTGRWAIELATFFPQASVIGTDIMVPPLAQRPHNFIFVRNNVLEGLPFADASFDFVHQRLLLPNIPMNKLRFLVVELLRVAAPGGWIELVEADATVQQGGSANQKMELWSAEASRLHGIEPNLNARIGEFLRMMHLENIEVRSIPLPLGRWGGRIGRLMAADMVALTQAMKPAITAQKGLSEEEYDHTCWLMQQEWELHHSTLLFYIAYGQRCL